MCKKWEAELAEVAKAEKVKILSSFFKTGKGEYGEGDIFIGVSVPDNRRVARTHYADSLSEISEMLASPIHEHRLSGLLALVERYKKCDKQQTVEFYLKHLHSANNWDLVDLSAPYILGAFVVENHEGAAVMYELSVSDNLWEQRAAIVSTLMLLRNGRSDVTVALARRYLTHRHELIHKATGWMLRELGKHIGELELRKFLDEHYRDMPRTMLRYSIERLSPDIRAHYMRK